MLKSKRKKIMMIVIAAICLIAMIVLIILPPSKGKLPLSEYPNGISERINLDVGDGKLTLWLISDDANNPPLLVCGGGPGIPQYLLEDMYGSPLHKEFTVCYWDYRGTGASFNPNIDPAEMTTDRYMDDAIAVTDYLSKRFSQEKIYIMGHSFGTYIASKTVQAYPERYKCYLAMSQTCNQKESEYQAFDYMKRQYEDMGNRSMVKQFQKYDIRSSDDDYHAYFFSGLRDKAMHDLGVGTTRDMNSVITGLFFPSLRCRAYTQAERINLWRGKVLSSKFLVTEDAIHFNAFEDIPSLDVPVCFIVGRYDYTCCASLQQEYYESIKAPEKYIYYFEESAHSPLYEEHERGREVLAEIKNHYQP